MRVYLTDELEALAKEFIDSGQDSAVVKTEGKPYYELGEAAESDLTLVLARGKLYLIRSAVAGELFS